MATFSGSGNAERRTIDEARIIELLLLRGWPIEVHQGARLQAEQEAQAALSGLIALGLPFRITPTGQRQFNPVEVSNFLIWASRNLSDPTFPMHYVASARRLVCAAYGDDWTNGPPPLPASLKAGKYRVTLRRKFNLTGFEPGKRIRLRMPMPLEDETLTGLQVELLPPAGVALQTRTHIGQMDILAIVPLEREMTLGIRASFTALAAPALKSSEPLSVGEKQMFLRPVEGLIRVTGRVQALADLLAGNERDAAAILRQFWEYMMRELSSGSIHYDRISLANPLDTVLDTGVFDCRLGSALLIAMCRARGIPARMISGYMLNISAPVFHTWLEVWIEPQGWYPVDLYGWGLTADQRQASDWRDHFYGHIDHRMVVERPPRIFCGTGDVRLPPQWHMLNFSEGKGATTEFRSMYDGVLAYDEHIEIERAY